MSATRFGRLHKATALVPLALLSAAWTASIAGVNAPAVVVRRRPPPTRRSPTAPACPTQAIEAPGQRLRRQPRSASASATATPPQIVSTASTSGIPSAALAAYQRAETVINAADQSCNLTWQLIAAIGRVESNHGRANGNILDDNGLADARHLRHRAQRLQPDQPRSSTPTPASTTTTPPTTARSARCSSSPRPGRSSAWTPTATACATRRTSTTPRSAPPSTSAPAPTTSAPTPAAQAAVYRYNHRQSYVDLVLSIMDAYIAGRLHLGAQRHRGGRLPRPGPDPGRLPATPRSSPTTTIKAPRQHRRPEPTPSRRPDPAPAARRSGGGNGGNDGGSDRRRPAAGRPCPPCPRPRSRRSTRCSPWPRPPPSARSTASTSSTPRSSPQCLNDYMNAASTAKADDRPREGAPVGLASPVCTPRTLAPRPARPGVACADGRARADYHSFAHLDAPGRPDPGEHSCDPAVSASSRAASAAQ